MKDRAIALAFRIFGSKFIRQGLAAVGGWFAAQGIVLDAFSLPSLIGGILAYLLAAGFSYFFKAAPDAAAKDKISQLAQALASQAIAFLAGVLQSWGYEGAVDDSVGVTIFAANYWLSRVSRPDAKSLPPVTGRAVSERPPGL